jgi:hypothetical protein
MWRIVIYDRTVSDEPAVAVSEIANRGEYELFHHHFDSESFRFRDMNDVEKETLEAFGIELPVVPIADFCISRSPREMYPSEEEERKWNVGLTPRAKNTKLS